MNVENLTTGKSKIRDRIERHHLLFPMFLMMTLMIYWQTRNFDFVDFDDPVYVTENEYGATGFSLKNITWAVSSFHDGNWIPLTWLSLMADVEIHSRLTGNSAVSNVTASESSLSSLMHLTNACLHLANALLLFLTLHRITGAVWKSGIVAALFVVHPLHVESVAWVTERKDVLSTFFGILAILMYASYVKQRGVIRYLAVFICLTFSLMSKPMLVTLPFVFLLLDFWPLNRLRFAVLPHLLLEKTPFFVLSIVFSVIAVFSQSADHALASASEIPLMTRLANALVVYSLYIGKMVWPTGLGVLYPHLGDSLSILQVAASMALLLFVTIFAMTNIRQRPYVLVGWLWYLGTLVPVIGILQIGSQQMADRYTYFPVLGLLIATVWIVSQAVSEVRNNRLAILGIAGLVVVAFMQISIVQAARWRNSVEIFQHTISVTRNNVTMHYDLGHVFQDGHRPDAAIHHYRKAIAIDPYHVESRNNLARVLNENGNLKEAILQYRQLLNLDSDNAAIHNDLGVALLSRGRIDEAVVQFRTVLNLQNSPNVAIGAATNLAWILATCEDSKVRNGAEAIRLAEFANLQSGGNNPQILDVLAAAYAENGDFDLAETTVRKAYKIAQAAGLAKRAGSIWGRIDLYRAGQPFHHSFGSHD